jgi:ABC-2 type transport system permease protein
LLATPVATWELLSAKVLAALVPGVLATWLAGLIVAIGVQILAISPAVAAAILSPERAVLLGLAAPLLALAAVSLTVAVSARANDVRTAQQTSGVLVVPVLLLLFGPAIGFAFQGVAVALAVAAVLALIAGCLLALAVRTFQRETVLTRWR